MKRGVQKRQERCRDCSKIEHAKQREKRKDKIKARAQENKEAIAAYQKQYRQKNKERLAAFYKERYEKRKQDIVSFRKMKNEAAARYRSDPKIRIKDCLMSRLHAVFSQSRIRKRSRLSELLGCSWEELKSHIEKQFERGMTWENRGRQGWHIDHIIPCSAFDHSNEDHIRQCWHYTNLRPMWAKDNLKKGAKVTNPQMRLLL
jgi:hypothetical protein